MQLRVFLVYWRALLTTIDPVRRESYLDRTELSQETPLESLRQFLESAKIAALRRLEEDLGQIRADEALLGPCLMLAVQRPQKNSEAIQRLIGCSFLVFGEHARHSLRQMVLSLDNGSAGIGQKPRLIHVPLRWNDGVPAEEAEGRRTLDLIRSWPEPGQLLIVVPLV